MSVPAHEPETGTGSIASMLIRFLYPRALAVTDDGGAEPTRNQPT